MEVVIKLPLETFYRTYCKFLKNFCTQVHGEEMEKSCDKQEFTTDSSTSKLRVQSPEKVFPCKHCGEKFSRAEKLKVCFVCFVIKTQAQCSKTSLSQTYMDLTESQTYWNPALHFTSLSSRC